MRWLGVAVGLVAMVGFGASVSAEIPTPTVTPATQTIEPSASFSVTYSPCFYFEEQVVFEFEGSTKTVSCDVPDGDTLTDGPQGARMAIAVQGSASATFTGPADAGTYTGIAYSNAQLRQGIRGPAAASLSQSGRVAQAAGCSGQFQCASFQVTVQLASTTTTTTTTTTTLAPTTSAAAVVPPAPTTVAPVLPETGPSRNDNTATIAIVLLAVGGALVLATRRRGGHPAS